MKKDASSKLFMSLYLNRAKIFGNTVGGYSKLLYSYRQQTGFCFQTPLTTSRLGMERQQGNVTLDLVGTDLRRRQGVGERSESGSRWETLLCWRRGVYPQNGSVPLPSLSAEQDGTHCNPTNGTQTALPSTVDSTHLNQ